MAPRSLWAVEWTSPRALRRLGARLALAVGSLLLTLASAEVAVRLFTDRGPALTVSSPTLGKHYLPHFDDRVFVPEAGRSVRLRFNRDGFRGPDRPYAKPPGCRRIAVIGDSMTVAVATEEHMTWTAQLERLLARPQPDAQWEVLNFGVSSASTGQELVLYRELVRRYQPDIVLVAFFVGNDLADNSSRLTSADRIYFELGDDGRLRQLPRSRRSRHLSAWLKRHSCFYSWYRTQSNHAAARLRERKPSLSPGDVVFRTDEREDVTHAWRLTQRLIAGFRDAVEQDGSRFVLASMPYGPQVDDRLWRALLEAAGDEAGLLDQRNPDRRLQDISRGEGVDLCILSPEFRDALASQGPEVEKPLFYYGGRGHLTDEGNRLAAEVIHRHLLARTLRRPEPGVGS